MKSLNGKRILFFAPAFFGYEIKIADKMKELGAIVDFYDERSIEKPYEKALLKISPKIFALKTKKYYGKIIKENIENNYDYIFVIKCEMLSVSTLRKLRLIYPNAIFCLYLYDSMKNIKGIIPKIQEFDRVFSFDSDDSKQSNNIQFRPLFYLDCYQKELNNNDDYQYDISFVGTIHSDRYRIIKNVKELTNNLNIRSYYYCYLQSTISYYFYKIVKREFRKSKKDNFSFQKLSSKIISEIIDNTRTVLDIQHPKQSGLTMRTIEMLGMNKKLITTNRKIEDYDFYNPNNILIIDRNTITIPKSFLFTPYQEVNKDIYKKYSIEQWIYDILGC